MLLIHMYSKMLFFSTPTQNYKEKIIILCSTINPYLIHGLFINTVFYYVFYCVSLATQNHIG